jgi:hypothetical protein
MPPPRRGTGRSYATHGSPAEEPHRGRRTNTALDKKIQHMLAPPSVGHHRARLPEPAPRRAGDAAGSSTASRRGRRQSLHRVEAARFCARAAGSCACRCLDSIPGHRILERRCRLRACGGGPSPPSLHPGPPEEVKREKAPVREEVLERRDAARIEGCRRQIRGRLTAGQPVGV